MNSNYSRLIFAEPESESDKTATAILRKKNKPNSLVVDDATNDDNSVITMSNNTMETLNLFRGDNVIVKGKKRKDTVLVALVSPIQDGVARLF